MWLFGRSIDHSLLMKVKSELDIKVGNEIRRVRMQQNRSQEDFADDCGINRSYMGNIERGEKAISIDMAKRVTTGLGIKLWQLFSEIDE